MIHDRRRTERSGPGGRAGLTLVELLMALVISAVISTALVGLFVGQTRLFGQQESQRSARAVSRTGINALLAELRMVETAGGVEAASDASVTLKVPYALGVVCATTADDATISLFPVDSTMYAWPGYAGYAWRDATTEAYTYLSKDADIVPALASVCEAIPITTLDGGRVIQLSPGIAAGAAAGTPVLLYRRVRYEFAASGDPSGGTTLTRTVLDGGAPEELVGPFDATGTEFNFYVAPSGAVQDAAPANLANILGLELVIEGMGNRPTGPGEERATAPVTTAVYFKNRSS